MGMDEDILDEPEGEGEDDEDEDEREDDGEEDGEGEEREEEDPEEFEGEEGHQMDIRRMLEMAQEPGLELGALGLNRGRRARARDGGGGGSEGANPLGLGAIGDMLEQVGWIIVLEILF